MYEIARLRVATALSALFLGLTAACAGPGSIANVPQYSPPVSPSSLAPSAHFTAAHLYVSDIYTDNVYRFPIVNGVVGATPDNTLHVAGPPCTGACAPVTVYGIGFDAQGNLYVGSSRNPNVQISEYGQGASGNSKPIRKITLPPNEYAFSVKVDLRGYVYVATSMGVVVYGPGASGNATPVATIPVPGKAYPSSLALGSMNTLYVSGATGTIRVYADPTTNPTLVGQICNSGATTTGLAIGKLGAASWLYSAGGYALQHATPRVYAWDGLQSRPCPTNITGRIHIAVGPYSIGDIALDLSNDELFIANSSGSVFEVRPQNFRGQTPIATLGAPLARPWGLALGP